MRIKMSELRKAIRKVIQEGTFWNKYGQPVGSRYRGGEITQNYGKMHRPDPMFSEMRSLLKGYASRNCHRHSLGSDMYMSGVWVQLAMGVLGEIRCHDGTEKPVRCTIKFKGEELVFTHPEDLYEFLNEPELLAMQKAETDKLSAEYGRY